MCFHFHHFLLNPWLLANTVPKTSKKSNPSRGRPRQRVSITSAYERQVKQFDTGFPPAGGHANQKSGMAITVALLCLVTRPRNYSDQEFNNVTIVN